MPPTASSFDRRLKETYEHSLELVRRAHERAERAVKRAELMREWARRSRRGDKRARGSALELALRDSERATREKDRFIAVVSHELRQPLNALVAALRVLESSDPGDLRRRAEAVMGRQVRQMIRLMDDLLEMSRISVGTVALQLETLELCDVVESALETIVIPASERDLRVVWTHVPAPAPVRGDSARLQQVFANLLSNAVRYTPPGGEVRVDLSLEPGWAVVSVADTGVGIAAENLPYIFEPFMRLGDRGAEGFGIGLALVKGLVGLHGGQVDVHSPGKDQGTNFVVRLPSA